MKILLVGEYNRAHKFVKEGLIQLGHEALVVGLTDGFKKVDIDIDIKHQFSNKFKKKIRQAVIKLFKIDLYANSIKNQILKLKPELSGFDVVQFINESPFMCNPETEKAIFDLLNSWNGKSFLLSCGTDYPSVHYAMEKKFKYSILTPFFENRLPATDFSLGLKYITPKFKALHDHIYETIEGVISSDMDYYLPLKDEKKHLGMIPHAINTVDIEFSELEIGGKIVIFHGINRSNYYKKGNDIFEAALRLIEANYSEKIEIITVESVPYATYIKAFDAAHILLDQVYAYDQGYNALEAMAKGKVVFSGAEQEWLDYYNVAEDSIVINALPDPEAIAKKLQWLILNPEELLKISRNAREFVEKEHHYIKCAKQYLKLYQNQ